MLEEIRKLYRATPFLPFSLELSSGGVIKVPHQDYLWITPAGMILVCDDAGVAEFVSPGQVTRVRVDGAVPGMAA